MSYCYNAELYPCTVQCWMCEKFGDSFILLGTSTKQEETMEQFIAVANNGTSSGGKPKTLEFCQGWAKQTLADRKTTMVYICRVLETAEPTDPPVKFSIYSAPQPKAAEPAPTGGYEPQKPKIQRDF